MRVVRLSAVAVVLLGGVVMILFDLGAWVWNGMNLVSSLYLAATIGGMVAAAVAAKPMQSKRLAWPAFAGSMALATVSLIWFYSLKQNAESSESPFIVEGISINLLTLCTFTAVACVMITGFCLSDAMRRPRV